MIGVHVKMAGESRRLFETRFYWKSLFYSDYFLVELLSW